MSVIVFVSGGKQKGERGREFECRGGNERGEILNRVKEII